MNRTQRRHGGTFAFAFGIALTLGVLGGPAANAQTTTVAPVTTAAPPTTTPATTAPATTARPATTRAPATTVPAATTIQPTTTVAPAEDSGDSTAVILIALAVIAAGLLIAVIVSRRHHDQQVVVAEVAGWRGDAVRAHGDATVLRDLLSGPIESDDSWWMAVQGRADTVDRQLAALETSAPDPAAAGAAAGLRQSLRSLLYAVESERLLYRRGGTPTAVELETAGGTLRARAEETDAALVRLEQEATGAPPAAPGPI